MFIEIGEEITGIIEKNDLDQLPTYLKEEFLSGVHFTKTFDGFIEFRCINEESRLILDKVNVYQKNKIRSQIRKENLHFLSSGIHTQEDIDKIYEIQQGLCYYTGEPLNRQLKNYSIDHIIPVVDGGSSWPSNIALTTNEVNSRKKNISKRTFFIELEKLNGKHWVNIQKSKCKKIDKLREEVDKNRRSYVIAKLNCIEIEINRIFPDKQIEYRLVNNDVLLYVLGTEIRFPAGFLRLKSKCFSTQYIESVIRVFL